MPTAIFPERSGGGISPRACMCESSIMIALSPLGEQHRARRARRACWPVKERSVSGSAFSAVMYNLLIGVWGTSKPPFLAEGKPRPKKPVLSFPEKPTRRQAHTFLFVSGGTVFYRWFWQKPVEQTVKSVQQKTKPLLPLATLATCHLPLVATCQQQ